MELNKNKTMNYESKYVDNLEHSSIKFRIPQHVYKLVSKLINFKNKSECSQILKQFISKTKQDRELRNIYNYFGWNEEKNDFGQEINYEELIKKLETEFDFNIKELEASEGKSSFSNENIGCSQTNQNILNNNCLSEHLIYNNSNLSLFNESNDMFNIHKPIPRNSQGDRNLMYPHEYDIFLTNSAKADWKNNSQHFMEDGSSITLWQKSTSKMANKTPSFHNQDRANYADSEEEKHSLQSNSNALNSFIEKSKNNTLNYESYYKNVLNENKIKHPNFRPIETNQVLNLNYSHLPSQINFNVSNFINSTNSFINISNHQPIISNKRKRKTKSQTKKLKNKQKPQKTKKLKKLKIKPNSQSNKYDCRNSNFGLKEISKKVQDIVQKLKKTTYKDISDRIISEINEKDIKDEKNIRRRIYDSLNVMKAMNLFKKDTTNKFILWNGDFLEGKDNNGTLIDDDIYLQKKRKIVKLENTETDIKEKHEKKKADLIYKNQTYNMLSEQYYILDHLLKRNEEDKNKIKEQDKIRFPFIIVEFPENKTPNNISIITDEKKSKLHFSLENPVRIYGDMDALKKLNSKLDNKI